MKKIIPLFIIFISLFSITSYAHSGRTDSNGGHYNRSTGEYHYHNGGYTEPVEEEENEDKEEGGLLLVNNNDNSTNETKTEVQYKQDTIGRLNKEIEEKNQEINEIKNEQRNWHYIYCFIIICIIIYLIVQKHYNKSYERLSNIVMKGLGTYDINEVIEKTSNFYKSQGIDIEK